MVWNNLFCATALACFRADEIDFTEGGASSGNGVPALLSDPVAIAGARPLELPLVILCMASVVDGLVGRGRRMRSASGSPFRVDMVNCKFNNLCSVGRKDC